MYHNIIMTLEYNSVLVLNDAPDAWALRIMAANWTLKLISSALEAIVYSMTFLLVLIEMVLNLVHTCSYIHALA